MREVNFFTYEKPKLVQLLARKPLAVAITTTFYVDPAPIVEVVRFVREHAPETKVIVGGPHVLNIASDYDDETQDFIFRHIGADIYIIDSQGEDTLARVISQLRKGREQLARSAQPLFCNGPWDVPPHIAAVREQQP